MPVHAASELLEGQGMGPAEHGTPGYEYRGPERLRKTKGLEAFRKRSLRETGTREGVGPWLSA